ALVLGIVVATSWANRPTMSPLFSGLSGEDASAVVDQLTAAGITYELTDGGATVLVPAESVYDQRIALAAEGLPTEEGGYSLLDDMGMTSSDFQQQVSYQRALEGELAKTVRALDGVSSATVHLALRRRASSPRPPPSPPPPSSSRRRRARPSTPAPSRRSSTSSPPPSRAWTR